MIITRRFEEIKRTVDVNTFCKSCNKKLRRVAKAMQTFNPWNKNEDGSVKDYEQVIDSVFEDLKSEVKKMKEVGVVCKKCRDSE